ncbi:hypothetical protein CC78DRAFT_605336 [Lojkania enalia]|uniref:Uncharacterized protein n=1 Tax=Lojkania enalia TaxID=147567 RepID=A0A9P4K6X5_9PLEO|nr:hypothetical protein CC78DRAFT_605336 [Didymosphaeria enalia]
MKPGSSGAVLQCCRGTLGHDCRGVGGSLRAVDEWVVVVLKVSALRWHPTDSRGRGAGGLFAHGPEESSPGRAQRLDHDGSKFRLAGSRPAASAIHDYNTLDKPLSRRRVGVALRIAVFRGLGRRPLCRQLLLRAQAEFSALEGDCTLATIPSVPAGLHPAQFPPGFASFAAGTTVWRDTPLAAGHLPSKRRHRPNVRGKRRLQDRSISSEVRAEPHQAMCHSQTWDV